jgi:solute carrier family 31 (copper transporter), member 1
MLAIFILGVLYEGLKYYRENLFWKSYNSLQYRAVQAPEKNGEAPETDNSRSVQ